MKFIFTAIGKPHEPYIKTGVEEFTTRISKYYDAKWLIVPPVKSSGLLPPAELKKNEAEAVLKNISKDEYLVALDETGKQLTSVQFAQFIQERANGSLKNLVFLIGGAYGLGEAVIKRSNYIMSLSALTFPHQLVRLILAEQVYRACTILQHEKYHHS